MNNQQPNNAHRLDWLMSTNDTRTEATWWRIADLILEISITTQQFRPSDPMGYMTQLGRSMARQNPGISAGEAMKKTIARHIEHAREHHPEVALSPDDVVAAMTINARRFPHLM